MLVAQRTRAARMLSAVALVAAAGVAMFGPAPALAQDVQFFGGGGGPGGGMGMGQPPINSKQVERYSALLGFNADQSEAAKALLDGMQAEWNAGSKKVRDEIDALREEFRESRDVSIWTDRMPGIMVKQRDSFSKLEKGFVSDLQSLLTEEQQGGWGRFERAYRRDTTIGRGRLSGESVDLLTLVEELPLAEGSMGSVKAMLDQYEADLDRALIDRNEIVEQAQTRVGNNPAGLEQALQDEEFLKLREKAREARLRVRETNQRYARQIASALPAGEAAKFNEEFTRRSFPDVLRATHTADSIAAAAQFEDLTAEQQQALAAMKESYSREVERLNKALMETTEKYEGTPEGYASALGGGMRMRMMGSGEGEAKSNPIEEARGAKRELEKRTLENLKSLLNDQQRERLPKRRERGEGARAMGFGGGPGGGPDGGPAVFVMQRDGEAPPEGEDHVMQVIRKVEIGPDGKPIEQTEVLVGKVTPGEEGEDGEDGEQTWEVEVVHAPDGTAPDEEEESEDADEPD